MFGDYIRGNVDSWFEWSRKIGLGVERMDDLILVTGRTLVSSWAAVAFADETREAEISLAVQALPNGGTSFVWSKIHGTVAYHHSRLDPVCPICFIYFPCANFLLSSSKEQSIPYNEPMCLYQGLPSSAPPYHLPQVAGCSRTSS